MPATPRPRTRGPQEQQRHDAAGRGHELGRPERRRGPQPRLRRRGGCRRGARRSTRGSRSAKRSPNSRASSTGNSTSPQSSPAAASTCSSATRPGCGRETDVDALLAEGDPWWQLALKPSEAARKAKREATLALPGIRDLVIDGTTDVVVTIGVSRLRAGLSATCRAAAGPLPLLHGADMEAFIRTGIVTLIHPETHFTDEKAALLREHTYLRLRRHWQFINELMLYEIDHHSSIRCPRIRKPDERVDFLMASSLYHPDTVERSLKHDGSGDEPGLKDPDGNWDLRPHRKRIINVTDETLRIWHAVMEDDSVPVRQTRMVYTVNSSAAEVLATLSRQPRAGALGLAVLARLGRVQGPQERLLRVPMGSSPIVGRRDPARPAPLRRDPDVQVAEPDHEAQSGLVGDRSSKRWPPMPFPQPHTSLPAAGLGMTRTTRSGNLGLLGLTIGSHGEHGGKHWMSEH